MAKLIRTKGAAAYLKVAEQTLARMRVIGGGPMYSKLGRAVVYDLDDLDAYITARKRTSTSDIRQSEGELSAA